MVGCETPHEACHSHPGERTAEEFGAAGRSRAACESQVGFAGQLMPLPGNDAG